MSEIEKEIQEKIARLLSAKLDEAFGLPSSAFGEPAPLTRMALENMYKNLPKPPLTMAELLRRLIENPDCTLICDYSAYKLARELRQNNVKLQRERKGKWLLFSESGKPMGVLYISKFSQGVYLVPKTEAPKWE